MSEQPRSTNIVPNYESYVMLRLNEIAEAIHHNNVIGAIEMLKTFYTTLPDHIKNKKDLKEKADKLDVICDVALGQRGINTFQTMRAQNHAFTVLANMHLLPFLNDISHELYLGGYYEKNWGPQTKKRDLTDIGKKLKEGQNVS